MTENEQIVARQRRRNQLTRDAWDAYAPHRERVTRLLRDAAREAPGRLAVLGAGNCNDLDLPALLDVFRELCLIDLDAEALASGLARQHVQDRPEIVPRGGVDVTGVAAQMAAWAPHGARTRTAFEETLRQVQTAPPPDVGGPFEVVASVCLLTQLIEMAAEALDHEYPRFYELILAVRDQHLRTLAELLKPGGVGFLITDVVSSDTCPELLDVPESELSATLSRLIAEYNFFSGANPFVLQRRFCEAPELARRVRDARVSAPWRWRLGRRGFLVCAVRIRG